MKSFLKQFKYRKIILSLADAFIIIVSSMITSFLFDLFGNPINAKKLVLYMGLDTVITVAVMVIFGIYSIMWRYMKKKDFLTCLYGVVSGAFITTILLYAAGTKINVLYAVVSTLIATFGICLFRVLFRQTFIDLVDIGAKQTGYKNTMIIGAGRACKMLLGELLGADNAAGAGKQNENKYRPVCIVDDDTSKIGTDVKGVTVVGTTDDIEKFVEEMKIEQIILAIPSCSENDRLRIMESCSKTKLPIKIVPFIGNLILDNANTILLPQVRDINVEDLLGRESIKFDNKYIDSFIRGKICMVTGGGGSIGSELVRQIAKYGPNKIIIVDIYENNAYDIQQEITMEYGDSLELVTLIASVRDYYRMNQIFKKFQPQIVFHAAAHKHVPLMENSPMEAIKNNIIGTWNTATLSQFHNVEKFVMISTDKAVNPTNVMGASKRCCEMIVQYLSQQHEGITEFVTTRFGNVLGSNGSVIPLFKRQIEQGKPVTVTHPDIIRYFMTIPEAVSLVMEAAAIANGGEIFVLDMGQPVKIVTLAENLIRMYGKVPYVDVEIKFTGLRPGEKIKEELLMNEEGLQKTDNKLIFIGKQIEIDDKNFANRLSALRNAAEKNDEALAISELHKMVPTFVTPEEFNSKAMMSR